MADLFKKLNTLVRARIDNLLEEDLNLPIGRRRRDKTSIDPNDPRLKRDIALLRAQIDEALDREEALQAEIDALRQTIDDLDQRANQAVAAQNEAEARAALSRMRQAEQQATMLEADLAHHRQMTAALMDQVNILESQTAAASAPQPESTVPTPVEPAPKAEPATEPDAHVVNVPIVVHVADEVPEIPAEPHHDPGQETPPEQPRAPEKSDDDLAARRARLARPAPNEEE